MRRVEVGMVLAAALLATACTPAAEPEARAAAEKFQAAVGTRDVAAGCALLSDQARQNVESVTAARCADALGKLNLAGGAIGEVSVWGDDAQAKLDSGALFLAEFRSGWKVTGAGCTFRGEDLPYDCDVEG